MAIHEIVYHTVRVNRIKHQNNYKRVRNMKVKEVDVKGIVTNKV